MTMNRTLVLLKPDAVARGLVGEIISRFERRQLSLVAAELRLLDRATAEIHYGEHVGKPFYEPTIAFMTGGPLMAMVLEGPENTWEIVRAMMGPTNSAVAAPGTIRGDLATLMNRNLIHGSDSAESAAREIALFFPTLA
jgi:nucleoside-diphosphate kinase